MKCALLVYHGTLLLLPIVITGSDAVCRGQLSATEVEESLQFPRSTTSEPPRLRLECEWEITASKDNQVLVIITDLTTDISDVVTIFDDVGNSYNFRSELVLWASVPVISPARKVTVKLVYNNYSEDSATAFAIQYKQVKNCGGYVTSLPSPSILSTPGFPHRRGDHQDCYWDIRSGDLTKKTKVTITDVQTSSGDYVEVFEHMNRFEGIDQSTVGSVEIISLSHRLQIYFHSNEKNSSAGFRATYQQVTCGSSQVLQRNKISGANSPEGSTHNLECNYYFYTPTPEFKMDFCFTVTTEQCCDYLEVFDSGNSLGRFQGNIADLSFTSTGKVRFSYYTDHRGISPGFYTRATLLTASRTFPETSTSTSKSITSPQYPNPYPIHLDYDWIIEAPMSLKISLTIVELDLPVCRFDCDYLEVFDGLVSVGKYAGKLTNVTVISATRSLRVRFHSDMFHDEAKGFRATHKLECSRRLNVSSTTYGLFQPPGYPKAFPPNSDCIYDFITEPGFKIRILIRRLDTDSCCDYLEISSDSVTLGRFRTIRSHSMTSISNSMRLYYHTDSEGSVQLFRIRYRKVK